MNSPSSATAAGPIGNESAFANTCARCRLMILIYSRFSRPTGGRARIGRNVPENRGALRVYIGRMRICSTRTKMRMILFTALVGLVVPAATPGCVEETCEGNCFDEYDDCLARSP